MNNLSKLSSDLPVSGPVDEEAVEKIDKELANEFKIGARSIAALYRLSNTKAAVVKASGYLNCLKDLESLVDSGKVTDLSELMDVIRLKRAELTGRGGSRVKEEKLEQSESFTISKESPFKFPPSRLPLAVVPEVKHRRDVTSDKTRRKVKQLKLKQKQLQLQQQQRLSESSDSEVVEDSSEDEEFPRKKVRQ